MRPLGTALAIFVPAEAGIALFVLGAGTLAAGAVALRRAASAAELERLDVSPAEQTYHTLRVARDMEDGEPARPSAADLDENERRLGELTAARCDHVWEGVRERRYVKRDCERVIDLDGEAIFTEIRDGGEGGN